MRTPKVSILVMLVLLAQFTVALAAEFKPVPGREYSEFYDPPTPVSGIAVVGATLLTASTTGTADELWVYFSKPFEGQLDLEIVSADGHFLGRGAYVGSSGRDEWVRLSVVPSGKRQPRPSDPGHESIAVSAQVANRDTLLVTAWGQRPGELTDQKIRLYVNSRRAQMMEVRVNPDPNVPRIKCESLRMKHSVRFDTVCTFLAADVPADRKITLVRRDGMQSESQTITLDL